MKAYTDIMQSKRLAEFLPLNSADMYLEVDDPSGESYSPHFGESLSISYNLFSFRKGLTIPCWSLAALYAILPDEIKDDGDIYRLQLSHLRAKYIVSYPRLTTLWPIFAKEEGDSSVDACYKMIVKLHEQKLI